MDYQVKHRTEISWYELDRIELPSAAEALINRPIQLSYRVRQQLGSLRESNALNSAENASRQKKLLQHLRRGEFFLLAPVGRVKQPALLRQAEVNADSASIELDCQISLVIISEQLRSALMHLLRTVERPKMVASIVKADPSAATTAQPGKNKAEKKKEPEKFWLKIQSLYDDKWRTPLPLVVEVLVDGVVIESGLELNKGSGKSTLSSNLKKAQQTKGEPGTILLEDIPEGIVEVRVKRVTGEEQAIASLKDELRNSLDSGYQDLVTAMKPFRQQWDEYGYFSLSISRLDGALKGGEEWLEEQAELFDGDLWEQFGQKISDGLSDALDYTASYIPETYDNITSSIEKTLKDSDNLTSWNWWQAQIRDIAIAKVRKTYTNYADAKEFLDDSVDLISKLFKHKNSILNLPKQIAAGDATSVQNFVDTVLKDIDPDLSNQIKESQDFYLVLELIADHDAALTYFTYVSLFLEAVPPNFYTYVAGKAGIYVVLEVLLGMVITFLTLGVGTAARLTALAAKFTVTSVRVKKKLDKADKAQAAVKAMIEKFSDSTDTLKQLGQKLAITRSAGRHKIGIENSTISDKKDMKKRKKKCRFCGGDHEPPKSLEGWVQYR